jgi:hypothetical protein
MCRGECLPPRLGFRLRRRSQPPPSAGTPRNAPNARNKDRYQAFGFIQLIYYWPELWAQNLTAHFRAFPFFSRTSHAAFFSRFLARISPPDPSGNRSWIDELDDSSAWPFLLSHIAFQALSYRLFGDLRDSQPYSSIRALLSSFDLSPFFSDFLPCLPVRALAPRPPGCCCPGPL